MSVSAGWTRATKRTEHIYEGLQYAANLAGAIVKALLADEALLRSLVHRAIILKNLCDLDHPYHRLDGDVHLLERRHGDLRVNFIAKRKCNARQVSVEELGVRLHIIRIEHGQFGNMC